MARVALRADGLQVRLAERDLGAHVVYSRQIRNRTIIDRISALSDFWEKLRCARGTLPQKLRAVRTAAWPRALHGVGAVLVGKKHWQALRSCYMKALKFAKPGANPMVQMLFDGFVSDPQLYAIWTSLLDFRAIGSSDLQIASLDEVGVQGLGIARASISEVFSHRVHQLGWQVCSGGVIQDHLGSFNLHECNIGELKLRVSWAWHQVVAVNVSCRLDFPGFEHANIAATQRGVAQFPVVDQAALRAVLKALPLPIVMHTTGQRMATPVVLHVVNLIVCIISIGSVRLWLI